MIAIRLLHDQRLPTAIAQGLGHQSYSATSDQALRNALEKT
jgi:hypothetical protein